MGVCKRILLELAPTFVLVVLSLVFAVCYYYIENNSYGINTPTVSCAVEMTSQTVWDALYYINTLHTTIGYGNLSPCSVGGRVITVIYLIISIPLTLVTLGKIGKWLTIGVSIVVAKIKRSEKPTSNVLLTIILVFVWIFISAGLMLVSGLSSTRNGVTFTVNNYGSALYFVVVSLTTVGLGDLYISDNSYCLMHFAIIFVGLALVTMCIETFQMKMEEFVEKISTLIDKSYRENIINGEEMSPGGVQSLFKSDRKSRLLSLFVSDSQQKTLVHNLDMKSRMRNATSQTDSSRMTVDVELQVIPDCNEVEMQTDEDKSQLRFRRKTYGTYYYTYVDSD